LVVETHEVAAHVAARLTIGTVARGGWVILPVYAALENEAAKFKLVLGLAQLFAEL
jgi:hypothetical protein